MSNSAMCSDASTPEPSAAGRGHAVVISGPSGSGKTTVVGELLKDDRFRLSISCTTRPMRPGEVNGREYHFLSRDAFVAKRECGEFLEWAEVYGNLYGTPRGPLRRMLAEGYVVLLNVDIQGGRNLRRARLDALYVFLMPPSLNALERRLRDRKTDSDAVIEKRLAQAQAEMAEASVYDKTVMNDKLQACVERVRSLALGGSGER